MNALNKDIQELILDRLTPKQKERWDASTEYFEDLLPKITKAKWAHDALREIDRRAEERVEAHFNGLQQRTDATYRFVKDNVLKGWKFYEGKAYFVVSKALKPGTLHSYEIELVGDAVLLTSTDGWKVHVHGYRSVAEICELSRELNK